MLLMMLLCCFANKTKPKEGTHARRLSDSCDLSCVVVVREWEACGHKIRDKTCLLWCLAARRSLDAPPSSSFLPHPVVLHKQA